MLPASQRFQALDVFRGMTICLMIIVNTPGDGATTFSPLQHASWDGFTPTDLVFPSFLFAVGNALSFVMNKWAGLSQQEVLLKIFKRTALIFLLGYLMYWFPFVTKNEAGSYILSPIANTRIFGVLQRIALCYGIAALMLYYFKEKVSIYLGVLFLFGYWLILYLFGDSGAELSMQGNAGFKLDQWLIGDAHMYKGEGVPFDPEGLLSTLPAVVNVIGGFVAGKYIQQKGSDYEGLSKLLLAGVGLLFLAYAWNLSFPINKKIWTSSYVLLTVGLDCVIIATIMYLIQYRNWTKGTYFFEVFGRNPLSIYLLSELMAILFWVFQANKDQAVYQWIFSNIFSHAGGYVGSLLFAIAFMLTCWLVGYIMDKKKIYIRV
jgi:predicted acyltransferase